MIRDKILGCIVGAASGDAMGAATECRSSQQIIDYFGDYVTTFVDPPADTFGRCNRAAMCTDDFLQAFYICEEMLNSDGKILAGTMTAAFRRWLDYPFYQNFTGPTTKKALAKKFPERQVENLQSTLESGTAAEVVQIINDGNSQASNGGAMKIWPAAVFHPGSIDQAIVSAIEITMYTHSNTLAISAAAAVAAATATALSSSASLQTVLAAGIYGAEKGVLAAKEYGATIVDGASVAARIKLAISLGQGQHDWRSLVTSRVLTDVIGNGLAANEAVPMVFGLLAAAPDNPIEAIYAAVNIGNDTDTIATMVGTIIGALHGSTIFPDDYLTTLNRANSFDLEKLADSLAAVPLLAGSTV